MVTMPTPRKPKVDPEVKVVLDRLNVWCKERPGRQALIARNLGVTRQQVYDWISAQRKVPSVSMWLRLKAFLDAKEEHEMEP